MLGNCRGKILSGKCVYNFIVHCCGYSVFAALCPFTLELVSNYCITTANKTIVHASCRDMIVALPYTDRSAASVREFHSVLRMVILNSNLILYCSHGQTAMKNKNKLSCGKCTVRTSLADSPWHSQT